MWGKFMGQPMGHLVDRFRSMQIDFDSKSTHLDLKRNIETATFGLIYHLNQIFIKKA